MTTKRYGVRFYRGGVGPDGEAGTVSELLSSASERQSQGHPMPQLAEGETRYELRDFQDFNSGAVFQGVLAVLRDEAPHIRRSDGTEAPIDLNDDEHVIEKNHFLFFQQHELLVWQVNGRASHVSRFERYLSMAAPAAVVFNDVLDTTALQRLEHGVVKRIKFRVASPKNAQSIDSSDWESGAFEIMSGVDATVIEVNVSTRRKVKGLSNSVKGAIHRLVNRAETRSLKVELLGDKQPIDIFADCLTENINVEMHGLYPIPGSIFAELDAAKGRQQAAIDAIFGASSGVLE